MATAPVLFSFIVRVLPAINMVYLGGTATFRCNVSVPENQSIYNYTWDGPEKVARDGRFDYENNMTILNIRDVIAQDNNTNVYCNVFLQSGLMGRKSMGRIVVLTPNEGITPPQGLATSLGTTRGPRYLETTANRLTSSPGISNAETSSLRSFTHKTITSDVVTGSADGVVTQSEATSTVISRTTSKTTINSTGDFSALTSSSGESTKSFNTGASFSSEIVTSVSKKTDTFSDTASSVTIMGNNPTIPISQVTPELTLEQKEMTTLSNRKLATFVDGGDNAGTPGSGLIFTIETTTSNNLKANRFPMTPLVGIAVIAALFVLIIITLVVAVFCLKKANNKELAAKHKNSNTDTRVLYNRKTENVSTMCDQSILSNCDSEVQSPPVASPLPPTHNRLYTPKNCACTNLKRYKSMPSLCLNNDGYEDMEHGTRGATSGRHSYENVARSNNPCSPDHQSNRVYRTASNYSIISKNSYDNMSLIAFQNERELTDSGNHSIEGSQVGRRPTFEFSCEDNRDSTSLCIEDSYEFMAIHDRAGQTKSAKTLSNKVRSFFTNT